MFVVFIYIQIIHQLSPSILDNVLVKKKKKEEKPTHMKYLEILKV
jgi:hypothetical protein